MIEAKPGIGFWWDLANACGLLAALLTLTLFVYDGRPLAKPNYDGKFFMNLHRDLSYAAIALLALHVSVLLITEPRTIEYLKPSANLPMVSGTVSTLLIAAIITTSLPRMRQKLWRNHKQFKRWHLCLAGTALGLMGFHMVGNNFYVAETWKVVLVLAAVSAALVRPLLGKRPIEKADRPRQRNTGTYASWLSAGMLVLVMALAISFAIIANVGLPL